MSSLEKSSESIAYRPGASANGTSPSEGALVSAATASAAPATKASILASLKTAKIKEVVFFGLEPVNERTGPIPTGAARFCAAMGGKGVKVDPRRYESLNIEPDLREALQIGNVAQLC